MVKYNRLDTKTKKQPVFPSLPQNDEATFTGQ
jgi:hypothetical protein